VPEYANFIVNRGLELKGEVAMFKKILTFLSIGLLGFQIPTLVNLWPSAKLASNLSKLEANLNKVFPDVSALTEQIKEAESGTVLEQVGLFVSKAQAYLNNLSNMFWASVVISLLLFAALFFLNRHKFLRNLGVSLFLGGGLTLLHALGLHSMFIINAQTTFNYLYDLLIKFYPALNMPLVKGVFEKFVPGFFQDFAKNMINLNFFWGALALLAGLVSFFIYKFFGKRGKKSYGHQKEYNKKEPYNKPHCTQSNVDNCRSDCKFRYPGMSGKQCESSCIDSCCSSQTAEEFTRRTGKK